MYNRIYNLSSILAIKRILGVLLILHNFLLNNRRIAFKNKLSFGFILLTKNKIKIRGKYNTIIIEDNTRLRNSKFTISGNNNTIIISGHCTINNSEFWIEDENNKIEIGQKTRISGAHIAVTEFNRTVSIGSDCLLSNEIDIRNGDSHSIIDLSTGSRINYASDIKIGDHIWLAKGVKILKGVEIGRGSIIGSGTIVTKNIPANSLAVGNPARIIKENVSWDINRIYE